MQGAAEPLPQCIAHEREGRTRMLLRFLRADGFDLAAAERRIRSHAEWWLDNADMDVALTSVQDEPAQNVGTPLCTCCGLAPCPHADLIAPAGFDVWGHPVLVARPSVHVPPSIEHSSTWGGVWGRSEPIDPASAAASSAYTASAVRATVHTVARCCDLMARHDMPSDGMLLLFDCRGLSTANWDVEYTKQLVALFGAHFPERAFSVVVLFNSWAVSGLWALVCPLLSKELVARVVFCGHDLGKAAVYLGDDHPYLTAAGHTRV